MKNYVVDSTTRNHKDFGCSPLSILTPADAIRTITAE